MRGFWSLRTKKGFGSVSSTRSIYSKSIIIRNTGRGDDLKNLEQFTRTSGRTSGSRSLFLTFQGSERRLTLPNSEGAFNITAFRDGEHAKIPNGHLC